jgi:monoamine oxidase
MLAAYELRKAGYQVQILEFQDRAGGRNISLRGGDTLTELGGAVQKVQFAPGNYINPGPWRIPIITRACCITARPSASHWSRLSS